MRASLGTRVRLLCRSTEYGVFGDVNFVLWAWGAVHSFTWGKMWFAFSFEIFLCAEEEGKTEMNGHDLYLSKEKLTARKC